MSDLFDITQCNLAQLIAESNRFLFQVFLIHISTCIIEGRHDIFSDTLFKTLLITAMAIVMYHIFFRKIVEPKLEKMKTICSRDLGERREKIIEIHQTDPLRPEYRKNIDKKIRETKIQYGRQNSKALHRSEKPERSKRSNKTQKSQNSQRRLQSPREYANR